MDTETKNLKAGKANHAVHKNMDHCIVGQAMRLIIANILVGLLFISTCLTVHLMVANIGVGVAAAEASITRPVEHSQVTARGLALDGATLSDSECSLISATIYPTPSDGYVTYPVSEVNGTVIVVVGSTSTPSVDVTCSPAQTVTVTVTASGTEMATYDAMSVDGAPPQASETTVNAITSSVDSTTSTDTTTTTTDETATMETTSSVSTMTSTEYVTLTVNTVTTYYVTVNETTTSSDDEPVTVPFNPTGIDTAGTTWTYYPGTGTGTWVIVTPTSNGTYTKPTHTPVSSVVSSGGSGKVAGRDERDRAVKSAFYCIVMGAAMGGWFGILA